MDRFKSLIPIMDTLSLGVFGMTIVDISVLTLGMDYNLITMSNGVKLTVSLVTVFYLAVVRIPHALKINKLNREEKYLQNELKKQELKEFKDKYKQAIRKRNTEDEEYIKK